MRSSKLSLWAKMSTTALRSALMAQKSEFCAFIPSPLGFSDTRPLWSSSRTVSTCPCAAASERVVWPALLTASGLVLSRLRSSWTVRISPSCDARARSVVESGLLRLVVSTPPTSSRTAAISSCLASMARTNTVLLSPSFEFTSTSCSSKTLTTFTCPPSVAHPSGVSFLSPSGVCVASGYVSTRRLTTDSIPSRAALQSRRLGVVAGSPASVWCRRRSITSHLSLPIAFSSRASGS